MIAGSESVLSDWILIEEYLKISYEGPIGICNRMWKSEFGYSFSGGFLFEIRILDPVPVLILQFVCVKILISNTDK